MCFKVFNKNIKKMTWKDISLIKLSVLFFTLFLAKIWPGILGFNWYTYLILFVLLGILPIIKIFR